MQGQSILQAEWVQMGYQFILAQKMPIGNKKGQSNKKKEPYLQCEVCPEHKGSRLRAAFDLV